MRTVVLTDKAGLRVEFVERSGSSPVSPADPEGNLLQLIETSRH
ncbi:hypothetical protein M2164_008128 [Streptomyces sp. SAI-208]|nr:hypothetical protein [Streptomyces sp. SAI-208]MDH6612493.1 hypothetical protein [Streptomyces sp. SAI-208]